jgi:hypothetical protein
MDRVREEWSGEREIRRGNDGLHLRDAGPTIKKKQEESSMYDCDAVAVEGEKVHAMTAIAMIQEEVP